ncbi:MmyB family transcriptional regulator [Nocardia sp. NPDC003482]
MDEAQSAPLHTDSYRRDKDSALELPSLGEWMGKMRQEVVITDEQTGLRRRARQADAASFLPVSLSYIKKIESNYVVPDRKVLEEIITGYKLDFGQARHMRELAEPARPMPSVAELRERLATPNRLKALDTFDEWGVVYLYTDALWQVVLANRRTYEAMPGLDDEAGDNIAVWHFQPGVEKPRRPYALFWDDEADGTIRMLRPGFGRYRESPRAKQLLEQLSASADFRNRWNACRHVDFGREPDRLCHMRNPETGEPYSASIHVAELPEENHEVRLHLVHVGPYSGPPLGSLPPLEH